jgi:UDP-N-acetylglucosamine acyltransferase
VTQNIHPTAIVADGARLAPDVQVGPYALIGPEVTVGAGTSIAGHSIVTGRTTIGRNNRVFHFACVGEIPQDRKYGGEPTATWIGEGNVIREFVTINAGTQQDRGETRIGNRNLLLAYSHIAHDCTIGDDTTFSNNAQLAGHVVVGDYAVLGGFVGVHQFCRVGAHAMVAAGSIVLQDVPPFVTAAGYPAKPRGCNSEGLKRRGFSADDIAAVRRVYKILYRKGLPLDEARTAIAAEAKATPAINLMVAFLEIPGRGIIR